MYSWVPTHKAIAQKLLAYEHRQKELIQILRDAGETILNDKDKDNNLVELEEIDPFTFFCYIYKYGPEKQLERLRFIANHFDIKPVPENQHGIPSANAQKVWLFPYKKDRVNNEVSRLWGFFKAAMDNSINNELFEDILKIKGAGIVKITEGLFYIKPDKYLPIDAQTKPYLKEILGVNPKFSNWTEYNNIINKVREKTDNQFYKISHEAWQWNTKKDSINYWIFQGNPKIYDVVTSLKDGALKSWSVSAHKDKIKVGDKIILWITGDKAGCYALCKVVSEVIKREDDVIEQKYYTDTSKLEKTDRVKIGVEYNFWNKPILKNQIISLPVFEKFKAGSQGTNFSATKDQYYTLLNIANKMDMQRVWLYAPGEGAKYWDEFYNQGIMGLGWDELGDLNQYKTKEEITAKLQEIEDTKSSKKNDATANYEFKEVVSIGDIIIAKKGRKEYLGFGIVTSDYYYDSNRSYYQKCRNVVWKDKGVWIDDFGDIVLKTLTDITDYSDYVIRLKELIGIETYKKDLPKFPLNVILYGPPGTGKTYHTILRAAEIVEGRIIGNYNEAKSIFNKFLHDRIEFITFHQNYSYEDFIQGLRPDTENNKELTFEKKDGIFKVIADRALKNLRDSEVPKVPKKSFEEVFNLFVTPLIEGEVEEIEVKMKRVSYFITAITNKSIDFRKISGDTSHTLSIATLKKMYEAESVLEIQGLSSYYTPLLDILLSMGKETEKGIEKVERKNYVIVIDEINRANISRVFGELITLIEPDKRSHGEISMEAKLPSGDKFVVPSNLYIIGTMNTADKSIALLDIALRRRFDFEAMYPKYSVEGCTIHDTSILEKINQQIVTLKGHDFQIGHSYFMDSNGDPYNFNERMNKKVVPLLFEYFMNDTKEVINILKKAGVLLNETVWPIEVTGKND